MKTMLALVALAGALGAAPATAQTPSPETHMRSVGYTDLDLRSGKDQSRLDRRIDIAVAAACGDASSADPSGKNALRRCRADAKQRVTADRDRVIAAAQGSAKTELAARR